MNADGYHTGLHHPAGQPSAELISKSSVASDGESRLLRNVYIYITLIVLFYAMKMLQLQTILRTFWKKQLFIFASILMESFHCLCRVQGTISSLAAGSTDTGDQTVKEVVSRADL